MLENRFKIRIWNKKDEKMLFKSQLEDEYKLYIPFDDLVFMQNTGLVDGKNNEIWEGDILKIENDFTKHSAEGKYLVLPESYLLGEVVWSSDQAAFYINLPSNHLLGYIIHNIDNVKVMGNIYENPKLKYAPPGPLRNTFKEEK